MKIRNILVAVFLIALIAWGVYDNTKKKEAVDSSAASTDASTDAANVKQGIEIGNRAPDFMLTSIDGKDIKLSELRGKKVWVNFWATWCPPCKAEMPEIEKLYKQYKEDDLVVLGVNLTHTESSPQKIAPFVKEYGLTFPVVLDSKGNVTAQYQVVAYPTSYIIDENGVIRNKIQGAMNYDMMKRVLKDVK